MQFIVELKKEEESGSLIHIHKDGQNVLPLAGQDARGNISIPYFREGDGLKLLIGDNEYHFSFRRKKEDDEET